MEMIYFKSYTTEKGVMIAMCDKELIDSILTEGEVVIDVKSYSSFYKGDLLNPTTAKQKLDLHKESIYSANIVGKESVDIAIEKSIIVSDNVKQVSGVPYAQAYRII